MRTATLLLALALGGCSLGDGDDGSDRPGMAAGYVKRLDDALQRQILNGGIA